MAKVASKFQRIRHMRHRVLSGLFRGVDDTGVGVPRLKKMEAWFGQRAAAMNGSGAAQVFTALPTGLVADGTLTMNTLPLDGETVTIGIRTYTFQTVLVDGPDNILIGATPVLTLGNLRSAMNGLAGSGTTYGSGTVPNSKATALPAGATTMDMEARASGYDGNSIVTTETLSDGSFAAPTLLNGHSANSLNVASHGYRAGVTGPVQVSTDTTLPAGLQALTNYWVVPDGPDLMQLYPSLKSAFDNKAEVDFTDEGTGIHSVTPIIADSTDMSSKSQQHIRSETIQGTDDVDTIT